MTFTAQGTFVQCTTTNCICVVKAQGPLPHLIMKLSVMQRIREVAERKKKSLKVKENKYKLGKLIFFFLSQPMLQNWHMRRDTLLTQKSSELDTESTLSRDSSFDS